MHEGNAIQFLASEVRNRTLRFITEAPDEALLWTPPTGGTQNHILWHAGHAVWLGDVLCIQPATGTSELPEDWTPMFGAKGRPPAETTDWPSRAVIRDQLQKQLQRMHEVIGGLSQKQLYTSPSGRTGETLLGWIVHGLHDEAKHQGEMFLLLKMWRHATTGGLALRS
jgi:hypothetical protein